LLSSSDIPFITLDPQGNPSADQLSSWPVRLQVGSSLVRVVMRSYNRLRATMFSIKARRMENQYKSGKIPVVTYDDLIRNNGNNLADILPERLVPDVIPYSFQDAVQMYQPTFRSLQFIKEACEKRHISLYLSTYPYPWKASVSEAIPFQMLAFNTVYDMRNNNVEAELIDSYAAALGVAHLNAIPVFQNSSTKNYGLFDPHMNANGYSLYATFLFQSLEADIRQKMTSVL
jgi:hypothetical protein